MDKKQDRPGVPLIARYVLLQLPGQVSLALILVILRQWLEIPAYIVWGLLGLWVAKDILLFPFLWRYYDPNQFPDRFRMVGRKGFALTCLNPNGFVQVQGERWQAELAAENPPIKKGTTICVDAIYGLKLKVRSCAEDSGE